MEKVINILLVEDDELDVIDIRRTLDKMKIVYHLQHARNGEEGLQALNNVGDNLPDVVLADINMPKMNGLEFLQALRRSETWKGLKCFIITTSDEKVDREAARRLGVSGFIVKPFKINNPSSMDSFNLMIDLMNMRG
ncbi:response regulator [Flaviaesturariibacter aridisoli]|uniref:Response regulator n=1 Tax=Flaviaesturariibacter aridisoli TaxID=2545761 RepID=A0A4R4DXS5_9BACT|nr:response regulator [Flaviaesturariibacter aridisoli]TCZ69911.1 response regulator [Flaviaesturariibacter aridisoli]